LPEKLEEEDEKLAQDDDEEALDEGELESEDPSSRDPLGIHGRGALLFLCSRD
jgi:hypothetical protein